MKRILIFISGIFLLISSADAQVIDTARFRLDYRAYIGNVSKINQDAVIHDTVTSDIQFDYYITPQRLDISFLPSHLTPVKMSKDPMQKLYRDFLRIGFGFPVTPLVELSVHNPDNSKFSYGLNLHHFSAWAEQMGKKMKKYAYAPTSDTKLNLFFTTFFKNQTLYSSVGYNHQKATLSGFHRDTLAYIPNIDRYYEKEYRDTLNNAFQHVKAEVGLRSNFVLEEKKLKQDVRLNYDFVTTHWKDIEHHIALTSFFGYDARFMKVSGSQHYRLGFNIDYYNNRWNDFTVDGEKIKNQSIKIEFKPVINFTIKEYHLIFGAGFPILRYLDEGVTKVPVYPIAELQLGIINGILSVYAGVDGKAEYNSLENLLYENPFLKPKMDTLRFTRNQIAIYGGVKGNLWKKLNYHIAARYAFEKDKHFFILDTTAFLKNQFDVMYQDVNTVNVSANINWEVISSLYLNLDANYWGYFFPEKNCHAWYKPTWTVDFNGKYVFKEKMVFDLNFNLEFGREALIPLSTPNEYRIDFMKPIIDFGVGFEYIFSKRFSAFARVNNIAGQHYAKYYDFKSYGLNVLLGVTYSFGDESLHVAKKRK